VPVEEATSDNENVDAANVMPRTVKEKRVGFENYRQDWQCYRKLHTFNLRISHYLMVFNYFNVELLRVCLLKPATVAVIFKCVD